MRTYDRRAFALAHAEAKITYVGGADGERVGYGPALTEYRTALLAGLERLFGLRVDIDSVPGLTKALVMLFNSTVHSYLAITSPGGGSLESGLLHTVMDRAGVSDQVSRDLAVIHESNTRSREAHLNILTTLLGAMLGDNADRVVHDDELRAIGVNTTAPDPHDYDF